MMRIEMDVLKHNSLKYLFLPRHKENSKQLHFCNVHYNYMYIIEKKSARAYDVFTLLIFHWKNSPKSMNVRKKQANKQSLMNDKIIVLNKIKFFLKKKKKEITTGNNHKMLNDT